MVKFRNSKNAGKNRLHFKKCIIISKCFSRWHDPLKIYLNHLFDDVEFLYVNNLFRESDKSYTGKELIDYITQLINAKKCNICIFDLEFSWLLSPFEVASISKNLIIPTFGIGMDDDRFHEINRILYRGVDAVLTFPFSVEKYRLIQKESYDFFPSFELAWDIDGQKQIKDIDVLFYGLLKGDRKHSIDFLLQKGIKINILPFSTPNDELIRFIKRSKIVLNFSSGSPICSNPIQFLPFCKTRESDFPVKQIKSRIFEVGNLGSLCLTDDFAGSNLFNKDNLCLVKNDQQMYDMIVHLLNDENFYNRKLSQFQKMFLKKYSLNNRIFDFQEYIKKITVFKKNRIEIASYEIYKKESLMNACSLATKMIYFKSVTVLFKHSRENKSFLTFIFEIFVSIILLIKIMINFGIK